MTRTGTPHAPSTHWGSPTSAYRIVADADTEPSLEAAPGLESSADVLLSVLPLPLPDAQELSPVVKRETDAASALDTLRAARAQAAQTCPQLRVQSCFIRDTSMPSIDRNRDPNRASCA
jgi:hypothetical protein